MVIMSFGSGFQFENPDPQYAAKTRELVDYARAKGLVLGGYSLCSSRSADNPADNVVNPKPAFGQAPCLGSSWGSNYLAQLKTMIERTGLQVLEHDGSYPGDTCAATNHPFHRGLNDSQWVQWKAITDLYQWCRANGVYLNVPDWYYLSGSSKCGMGYREANWSLPREYQELIERQNIFDGTWDKTASMGWMFVPLTEYQGGGPAATIEPLREHLGHYEQRGWKTSSAPASSPVTAARGFTIPTKPRPWSNAGWISTSIIAKSWTVISSISGARMDATWTTSST